MMDIFCGDADDVYVRDVVCLRERRRKRRIKRREGGRGEREEKEQLEKCWQNEWEERGRKTTRSRKCTEKAEKEMHWEAENGS